MTSADEVLPANGGLQPAQEIGREEAPQAVPLEPSHASGEAWNGPETGFRERPREEEDAGDKPTGAEEVGREEISAEPAAERPPEPALTSTYDPTRVKRAGWWSRRSAESAKE